MTSQNNDSNGNSTQLRPAPYAQRRRIRINKTTLAAWITGIVGTLMFLLLINPSAMTADILTSPEPSVAQTLLPTVTPTPAIISAGEQHAQVDAPAAKVDVKQLPYPVATPLSFAVRAKFAITQTGVISLPANIRTGPGTDFDITEGIQPGVQVEVIDCNESCDWYELANGNWVAAWLVDTTRGEMPLLTSSPKNAMPEVPSSVTWGVVTSPMLEVRVGPGADYAVADFRAEGSCIPLLAAEDNWIQVPLSHDTSGWAVVDHVRVVNSCPSGNGQMVMTLPDSVISSEPSDAS